MSSEKIGKIAIIFIAVMRLIIAMILTLFVAALHILPPNSSSNSGIEFTIILGVMYFILGIPSRFAMKVIAKKYGLSLTQEDME